VALAATELLRLYLIRICEVPLCPKKLRQHLQREPPRCHLGLAACPGCQRRLQDVKKTTALELAFWRTTVEVAEVLPR